MVPGSFEMEVEEEEEEEEERVEACGTIVQRMFRGGEQIINCLDSSHTPVKAGLKYIRE